MHTAAYDPTSVEGEEFPGHSVRPPVYGGGNALKRNLMPIAGEDVHRSHASAAANRELHAWNRPFATLKKCVQHPLTDRGLETFLKDWEKVQ